MTIKHFVLFFILIVNLCNFTENLIIPSYMCVKKSNYNKINEIKKDIVDNILHYGKLYFCIASFSLLHMTNNNMIDTSHSHLISYENFKEQNMKKNIKEFLIKRDENIIYIKLNNNEKYFYIFKNIKFYTGKSSQIILIKN